jgi:N-methylhydantoinase B
VLSERVDSVALGVVGKALLAISREMATNLRRSAYSTIVREARDFSVAILDVRGQIVAQAEMIPIQTGGVGVAFEALSQRGCLDQVTADTGFLVNDPFQGGQHLQDIFLFTPLFVDTRLVGYAASVAHHVDVGGAYPGLTAFATDTYQEGIRLPLAPFSVQRDWGQGFVEQIIRSNVRVPDKVIGDINAQFAANHTASERVNELCERYGVDFVLAVMDELQDYAERRTREGIRSIPDGVYRGEAFVELAPWKLDPARIAVTLEVDGDEISADFTGTDPEVPGNVNCPLASAISAVHAAVKGVLDERDIPFNAGCNRPVRIEVPYGTILNPRPPAAVRARMSPASRVFDSVISALAEAVPERVIATGFNTTTALALSHREPTTGRYRIIGEVLGGGWGATATHDGMDALDNPLSNCANVPIEALEIDNPHLRIESFALRPGSGGDGTFRGGRGFERVYAAASDDVLFAAYSDRHDSGAPGLFGGGPGAPGAFVLRRADGTAERLPCVASVTLQQGDSIAISVGGGGGYGPPENRPKPKEQETDVDVR